MLLVVLVIAAFVIRFAFAAGARQFVRFAARVCAPQRGGTEHSVILRPAKAPRRAA